MKKQIPLFKVFLPPRDELLPALESTLYGGYISEGPKVAEFEARFAEQFSLPRCLSFCSGTAALHSALLLGGVGPGDEVISTPMTAEPTNMAIRHAGADIVWADVDPRNGNIDPKSVAERITDRTRALMVVHYGGIPVPLDALTRLAERHGSYVIEDAAHALGAKYGGRPIGTHSRFVMFSLQAIKHMTTVDGGMLACESAPDADRGVLLRWFGIDRNSARTEVDVETVGYKYHMNDVTATLGLCQLNHVESVLDAHIGNGRYFDRALRGMDGVELCTWETKAEPSYWMYTVLVDDKSRFVRHLREHGIAASEVHRRNDRHPVFADSARNLPGLDRFQDRMVHLPCGWWVSKEDREFMVDTISEGW